MRKWLYAVGLAGLVAIAVIAAVLVVGAGGTPSGAAATSPTASVTPTPMPGEAFPTEVEATLVGSVTTADGQTVHLPETTISCPLVGVANGPVYDCRGAWDTGPEATSLATIAIGYGQLSGLPAHTWTTVALGYGESFSSVPYVTLGPELGYGDYGHIEDPSNPDSSRGVYRTYFYYKTITSGGGTLGTEWHAILN
jgi:hypothetical protein